MLIGMRRCWENPCMKRSRLDETRRCPLSMAAAANWICTSSKSILEGACAIFLRSCRPEPGRWTICARSWRIFARHCSIGVRSNGAGTRSNRIETRSHCIGAWSNRIETRSHCIETWSSRVGTRSNCIETWSCRLHPRSGRVGAGFFERETGLRGPEPLFDGPSPHASGPGRGPSWRSVAHPDREEGAPPWSASGRMRVIEVPGKVGIGPRARRPGRRICTANPCRVDRGLNGSARGPPCGPRGDGALHGVRLARGPLRR